MSSENSGNVMTNDDQQKSSSLDDGSSVLIRDATTGNAVFRIREVQASPSSTNPVEREMMERIGRFRYDLWNEETVIDKSLFPNGVWTDQYDDVARHWIAEDIETGNIVAVSRMTFHERLEDNPDGYLWLEREDLAKDLPPSPTANISKLAVHKSARRYGIAKKMSEVRLHAARLAGIKSILVTASAANTRILQGLSDGDGNWKDTGIRVKFPNRPEFEFLGLELRF